MQLRYARVEDIPLLEIIRNAVTENRLSDPTLISKADYHHFITERGIGWVCETDHELCGFSILDLKEQNVWALFVKPGFEGQGIGRLLHDAMLHYYFQHSRNPIWLGTAPNTRAEGFYRKAGWKEIGVHGKGEIKFEMDYLFWSQQQSKTRK